MASTPELVESKDLYHETAKEIGGYDTDRTSAIYESTTQDVQDMKRMGKTQELRVGWRRLWNRNRSANSPLEKLSKDLDLLLHLCFDSNLGIPLHVDNRN
jgi:hypothetical protein